MKFSDALDRKVEEITRPPVPPIGTYIWTVKKHPDSEKFDSRNTGKTFDRLNFLMSAVAATDEVDPDELEAYGDINGFVVSKSFLFDNEDEVAFQRSEYNLKRFFEHLGMDLSNVTISEALANSVGATCMGELKHRPDPNDAEVIYAELGKTAPAE